MIIFVPFWQAMLAGGPVAFITTWHLIAVDYHLVCSERVHACSISMIRVDGYKLP